MCQHGCYAYMLWRTHIGRHVVAEHLYFFCCYNIPKQADLTVLHSVGTSRGSSGYVSASIAPPAVCSLHYFLPSTREGFCATRLQPHDTLLLSHPPALLQVSSSHCSLAHWCLNNSCTKPMLVRMCGARMLTGLSAKESSRANRPTPGRTMGLLAAKNAAIGRYLIWARGD